MFGDPLLHLHAQGIVLPVCTLVLLSIYKLTSRSGDFYFVIYHVNAESERKKML